MLSPDDVKKALLSLEDAELDFAVIFSGKKSKKVNGLYKCASREIIIQNRNFQTERGQDENQLMYTALHEYAHHLHGIKRGGSLPVRAHGPLFWSIFHGLLEKAEERGLYRTGVENAPELKRVTALIKEKYLNANGLLFKEFGELLSQAGALCKKIGLRFEDYLDRVLRMPKTAARAALRAFEYDINPALGVDNMRYVAGLPSNEQRAEAERSFLRGKSPDSVKTEVRKLKEGGEEDGRATLEKEKRRLERTIASLQKRLETVSRELEKDAGAELPEKRG